jgi:hypothetical protein
MVQSRPPEASATGVLTGIGIARNAPQQVHISRYRIINQQSWRHRAAPFILYVYVLDGGHLKARGGRTYITHCMLCALAPSPLHLLTSLCSKRRLHLPLLPGCAPVL